MGDSAQGKGEPWRHVKALQVLDREGLGEIPCEGSAGILPHGLEPAY